MTLSKELLAEDTRPAVIEDLVGVVQQEVASKKGVSGAAIKAGYGAASRVVPNLTQRALDKLLPDFLLALDPFWADFDTSGGSDFGRHLADRGDEATPALLAVTDAKVASSSREPVKKAYRALRGKADGHVRAALPRVGAALQRHARPTG
jgi:hypothetical protein